MEQTATFTLSYPHLVAITLSNCACKCVDRFVVPSAGGLNDAIAPTRS